MLTLKKYTFLLTLIIVSISCEDKKENFYFEKVTPPKEDSTKVWLRQNDNYQEDKEHYLKVFFKYYNSKLTNKEYLTNPSKKSKKE